MRCVCALSSKHLIIDHQVRWRCNSPNWKPFYGVSVEEGPGRNDEGEDCGSANQAYVNSELDILKEVADEERDRLKTDDKLACAWLSDR